MIDAAGEPDRRGRKSENKTCSLTDIPTARLVVFDYSAASLGVLFLGLPSAFFSTGARNFPV
jgi:hypothetical protein